MTTITEAAVEAARAALTTHQMRRILHAAGLEFFTAQDALIGQWARLAIEAAAPLIAPPDGAVLAEALTALQACVDQLEQDTAMLYAEYAGSAETTEAEKLARAALARSAAPQPRSVE